MAPFQGGIEEADRLIRKGIAQEMFEKRVIELEIRNLELLVHNNELLARARKAEAQIPKVGFPLQVNDTLLCGQK
jgi:hypothetical protein